MSRIVAAILAAGTSSRLGTPKQLLLLGDRPVLWHTIQAVKASSVESVLVVLGHQRDEIERRVDLSSCAIIDNPHFAEGQSTSVQAVARAVEDDVDAIVFVLGDQPLLEPDVIDALVRARRERDASIVQPRYAEGRGNPILIGRELFRELRDLTGDMGARPLLQRHQDLVALLDVSDHRRPADIDTRDDYEKIKQQYQRSREPGRMTYNFSRPIRYCPHCGQSIEYREIAGQLRPHCEACRATFYAGPQAGRGGAGERWQRSGAATTQD